MDSSRVFVLTGPESSGKTTLATQLSESLKVPLVQEVSREYLNGKIMENPDFSYSQSHLLEIARLQHKQEIDKTSLQPESIICDKCQIPT